MVLVVVLFKLVFLGIFKLLLVTVSFALTKSVTDFVLPVIGI